MGADELTQLVARMATDDDFAARVRRDPAALDDFSLSPHERERLLGLSHDPHPGPTSLGARMSKSPLFFPGGGRAASQSAPDPADADVGALPQGDDED